jgi:hypothetical protein
MKQCPARTTCVAKHWKLILTMVAMARVTTMSMTMTMTGRMTLTILRPGVREQAEMARMVMGMKIVAIAWQ